MKHFIKRTISLMLVAVILVSTVFAFSGCVNPNPDSWGYSSKRNESPKLYLYAENNNMPKDAVTLQIGIGLYQEGYNFWPDYVERLIKKYPQVNRDNLYLAVAAYPENAEWYEDKSHEEWEGFYFFDEVKVDALGLENDNYSYTYNFMGGAQYNNYMYVTIPEEFFENGSDFAISIFLISKSTSSQDEYVFNDLLNGLLIGYGDGSDGCIKLLWADVIGLMSF